MASLKRRRPEKWMVTLFYSPRIRNYEYDTPLAALGMAGRISGTGVRASVSAPDGAIIAEFKPRLDPLPKIKRDPNLGPNLQRAAKARKTKKRTLTRRKA